jgi:hypothetical protein
LNLFWDGCEIAIFFLPTAYDRGRPPDPPLAEATHATRTPGANAAVSPQSQQPGRPPDPPLAEATHATRTPGANAAVSPQSQQPGELNALYDTAGYGVLLLGA